MKKLLFIFLLPMVIPAFAQKWAKDFDFVDNPSNGLSLVKKDGKYGFVDLNGKIVVPIEFQEAVAYSEGFAPVRKGSLWGFYDSTGKVLVQPVYLDALCFLVQADLQQVQFFFQFDPGAAGGDDLGRVLAAGFSRHEVDSRGTLQLGNHHPLGAVDDKRSFFGHEGDLTEKDLLLLDITDGFLALLVFTIKGQAQFDFQGDGIIKSFVQTFFRGVVDLEPYAIAAQVAGLVNDRAFFMAFTANRIPAGFIVAR